MSVADALVGQLCRHLADDLLDVQLGHLAAITRGPRLPNLLSGGGQFPLIFAKLAERVLKATDA